MSTHPNNSDSIESVQRAAQPDDPASSSSDGLRPMPLPGAGDLPDLQLGRKDPPPVQGAAAEESADASAPTAPAPPGPSATRRPTTQRQIDANRQNAKKSTGPSEEGKKRSSRNAEKHGAWSREVIPIKSGPFREDPDQFHARVEELMADLRPEGTAQMMAAKRVAAAFMRLDRTDRAEAALLLESSSIDPHHRSQYPDPDVLSEAVGDLEDLIEHLGYIEGTEADIDDPLRWHRLARLIRRYSPDPRVGVKDLWTDEATPVTEGESKAAALALYRHHWPNQIGWYVHLMAEQGSALRASERAEQRQDAQIARQMLAATSAHIDRARTAAWTEFNRAYKVLRDLQAREVEAED